jgi:hypothetical protein
MPQIDTAGRHRAQEHARSWRLRLRLRHVGRHGRCGCAGWQVGATGAPYRAHTGPDRGRNGGQIMRMRRKGAEFEALGLLRTFAGGPAAAQWAMAGGAPAPQLNDRSRPRPQCGRGRERLPPLAAHRHMRPLHVLEPCRAAEAGARVQASIEGFEPTFSTCSGARSSTTCCQRWAARHSALIDGRHKARRSRKMVAHRK